MTGFSADWLRLREPIDRQARSPALAHGLAAALRRQAAGPLRIVDLAAGSGANFRVLAPLLGGDQNWLLVDHDPALLTAQRAEIVDWATRHGWRWTADGEHIAVDTGLARWTVRGQGLDLASELEALERIPFDGLVTTAFLDLVSATWLDRLGKLLARLRRPLLATLTVDGRRAWHPPHPADAPVLAGFQRHQGVDKGFGPSLANEAVAHLAACLASHGHRVTTARSDWRIGASQPDMLRYLLDEAAAVARAADPAAERWITSWATERQAQLDGGLLALEVGHLDLLALPPHLPL
ncbi:MAG: class I SAM-dependent methyltransferase [Proteobacteria bacterium]|nr:class I SAM-dependent methyltransferase [Pseudomonadota bacterium]